MKLTCKAFFVLAASGALLLSLGALASWKRSEEIPPLPESAILKTARAEGKTYKLADDGRVFTVNPDGKKWTRIDSIFDPKEIAESHVTENGKTYAVVRETGQRYPVLTIFREGFEGVPEGVAGLRALIGPERKWTELTLQTARTPTVPDYVALRRKILKEGGDFLDARVEPSSRQAHSGKQSLRFFSPAKSATMVTAKASLATGLLYSKKGQTIAYHAWYRVDGETLPFTLADLEDRLVKESPGIRLMLFDGVLGAELKAFDKPTFRQRPESTTVFPRNRWVEIRWEILLDDGPGGQVRIWQDGKLIVDATGPTLPFRTAVYNSLEVGISAHSFGDKPATLYLDDLEISTK